MCDLRDAAARHRSLTAGERSRRTTQRRGPGHVSRNRTGQLLRPRVRLTRTTPVHYTAGVGAVGSFAGARALPGDDVLTTLARVLLEGAGALFGLYLVLALGLAVYGTAVRRRARAVPSAELVAWPRSGEARTGRGGPS
jgi:hypothetical protein